jgi:peroxiredoxin
VWLLLGVALSVGCPHDEELTPKETLVVGVGDPAPGLELGTLDGEVFDLEMQHGKVVLLNFFATWCPPCREELPHLEERVWQRFKGDGFALLVIGRGEGEDVIRPFVEQYGYSLPFAADPDKAIYSLYASRFIPRNFVIGPDGTILFESQGFEPDEFERMIEVIERAVADLDEADEPGEAPSDQAA